MLRCRSFVAALLLLCFGIGRAETADSFTTRVTPESVDPAAFTQWVDGLESAIVTKDGSGQVLWTTKTKPSHAALPFGESKTTGPRHLRLGFHQPITVGSVVVRGGGRLSVLKADAPYPGNVTDEAQWLPAERLKRGELSREEVGPEAFAVWTLPPGTSTRALRFTHEPDPTDKSYAGILGGVSVLSGRFANLAPQALALTGENPQHASDLINEAFDRGREGWENEAESRTRSVKDQPAWITLSWPQPVKLSGLVALWAAFADADVQILNANVRVQEATEADWQSLSEWTSVDYQYPRQLGINGLDFGHEVTLKTLRLRLKAVTKESHPHLNHQTKDGNRVWLGELMALRSMGDAPLAEAAQTARTAQDAHPPIAIPFRLEKSGLVTLVIEDGTGHRIRNLISETPFPAGNNTAWWDGLDDLGRDPEAAKHGIYAVPGSPVKPGRYTVRGLVHDEFDLRYEFACYTAGDPAWNTEDGTGAWLANHTPPSAALFLPGSRTPDGNDRVYLGSYVSEGTHGLAWVDLDGKKLGGKNWVGGAWTGAPYLARDDGDAVKEHLAYVASVWTTAKGSTEAELRLTALTAKDDVSIYRETWPLPSSKPKDNQFAAEISGLAVRDGVVVVAMKRLEKLVCIDARTQQRLGEHPLPDPRGIAFDAAGHLLALSEKKLHRFAFSRGTVGKDETIITSGLEDPQHVLATDDGRFYVSDWGASHQVKNFDQHGALLRAIGHAGTPRGGLYDPQHMNHPAGLTVDNRQRLWVTEQDEQPKRVSVWSEDGKLLQAFYGPAAYGGGGALDSGDEGLYHYQGMTFRLDWKAGKSELISVPYRTDDAKLELGFRNAPPETAIHRDGRRYLTNCYNSAPTGGSGTAFLFLERDHIAVPVAGMGRARDWTVLKAPAFASRWPQGMDPNGNPDKLTAFFVWSDLNGDGQAQPEEVEIRHGQCGGVTVMPDLSFVLSRVDGKALRLAPAKFSSAHVPAYDIDRPTPVAADVANPKSSGGDQALVHPDGWSVITLGVGAYSPYSLCGVFQGEPRWSYPSPWPGLHASHEAAVPDHPGEVIGSTRLLGGFIKSAVGPLWCVNGNMGPMYLFTADGLFVQTLFKDIRTGRHWAMPRSERGMKLNELSPHDENFFPSIGQTPDGRVYLIDGGRSSLVKLEGLDSLKRLPDREVTVTEADLAKAREWTLASEAQRQSALGHKTLELPITANAPTIDGKLDDWKDADWAIIDKRGTHAWFNSNSKPYDVSAAIRISGDRLYAAFRTGDPDLLKNSGATPKALFKTGGALDLMIGSSAKAAEGRTAAAAGDMRLIVSLVEKKPTALLYRPVVPGTAASERVPFSSPWRTIYFDRVDDVGAELQFAAADGNYELSIPLRLLQLDPAPGATLRGDLGVLRGSGFETTQRIYWSNKATAITADVPSEAELTPQLWGMWKLIRR